MARTPWSSHACFNPHPLAAGAQAVLGTDRTRTKANVPDVGTGDVNLGYSYDGLLDDLVVFSRVLSASEMLKKDLAGARIRDNASQRIAGNLPGLEDAPQSEARPEAS